MKKIIINLLFSTIILFCFKAKALETIKIGASSSPHAEILEAAKPILATKGINLKIIIFQDYIMPNKALAHGDLDANYYQHIAFLNKQNEEFGYNLVNLGSIHIEPIGLYSKQFNSIKDIKDGTTVIMSNSIVDRARILSMLEELKLIKLRNFNNTIERSSANINDILENYKNLKFKADIQPSLIPKTYFNNSAGLIFINTNYAISSNIDPKKHSLYLENTNKSLYANILVSRKNNSNDPKLKILLEVLRSKPIQDFILKKYNGLIIPV